jgi:triphosphoribosyl-dephospho-CoA synthase
MMARGLHECASRGIRLSRGEISPEDVRLGELIHVATCDSIGEMGGKNTILGTILLYVPLVVSLGAHLEELGAFSVKHLRRTLCRIVEASTVEDCVNLYEAFQVANPGGAMIKEEPVWKKVHERYDIDNPRAIENIRKDEISLIDLLRVSAPVDEIAAEWASGFEVVLKQVFPYLDRLSSGLESLEEAVVMSHVWLLSRRPDGLIVKKAGLDEAERVMHLARSAVSLLDEKGDAGALLAHLDNTLRTEGNMLNPGTTADLVSAATLCKLASDSFKKR